MDKAELPVVAVIGGGFCGLSAAYELGLRGVRALVLERDHELGGLAGSFAVDGARLEKTYHHWFTSDEEIITLAEELGTRDRVLERATQTGVYYDDALLRLSTPRDMLGYRALALGDRIRLGMLALRTRRVSDWRQLESVTAAEWLRQLGGEQVFEVVWEPLLRGKFGEHADEVSAVWIWSKIKLRGGSRDRWGRERLLYYRGGFSRLIEELAQRVKELGGSILTGSQVDDIEQEHRRVTAVLTGGRRYPVAAVIATPALPDIARLLERHIEPRHVDALRRVRYLANVCVVLELERRLSDRYWINVNDPTFPFVGIVEHTNLEPPATYGDRHIVYLSAYMARSAALWQLEDVDVAAAFVRNLKRVFTGLADDWVKATHVWRAPHAQPLVERDYGRLIDDLEVPLEGFHIATMAQVYPEDRGTNHAIRLGRATGRDVAARVRS